MSLCLNCLCLCNDFARCINLKKGCRNCKKVFHQYLQAMFSPHVGAGGKLSMRTLPSRFFFEVKYGGQSAPGPCRLDKVTSKAAHNFMEDTGKMPKRTFIYTVGVM